MERRDRTYTLGDGGLSRQLLGQALAPVCRLQHDKVGDYYVSCPVADWRERLQNCHDWAKSNFTLPDFVGEIADWFCVSSVSSSVPGLLSFDAGVVNGRYEDRLIRWDSNDRKALKLVVNKLVSSRHRKEKSTLTAAEFKLAQAACETLGDLPVGGRVRTGGLPWPLLGQPRSEQDYTLVGPWPLRDFLEQAKPE